MRRARECAAKGVATAAGAQGQAGGPHPWGSHRGNTARSPSGARELLQPAREPSLADARREGGAETGREGKARRHPHRLWGGKAARERAGARTGKSRAGEVGSASGAAAAGRPRGWDGGRQESGGERQRPAAREGQGRTRGWEWHVMNRPELELADRARVPAAQEARGPTVKGGAHRHAETSARATVDVATISSHRRGSMTGRCAAPRREPSRHPSQASENR